MIWFIATCIYYFLCLIIGAFALGAGGFVLFLLLRGFLNILAWPFQKIIPFLAWISDLPCWKWKNFWKTLGLAIGCVPAITASVMIIDEGGRANITFWGQMMTVAFFWLVTMSVLIRGLKSAPKC